LTTLTKIFIVVLAVFAIVISMVVIQYTAQSTNFKQLADEWQGRANQESALRAAADNQNKLIVEHLDKVGRTQQEELSKQRTEMERISGEMSAVKNELLAERQKTASLTGQVTQLTNMTKAGDEERKQLQGQLESTRKDNAGLRADNFKLAETNQKLDLQRQLYEQEIRLLKEQNYSINERLAKLRTGGSATASESPAAGARKVQAATESETSPILGQITDVRDSLASISIGSAQGVKDGMEFIIYRNGQYLGKMRINKVLPEQAAGELLSTQGSVRSGDKVTDKFQF
jgi:chromosome segregation ATPase